ncbi:MAG: hypothetical protein ACLP9L_35880, partial [Thermoguttaceae bacterium]
MAFALSCSTAWAQLDLVHRYSFSSGSAGLNDSVGTLNGTAGSEVTFNATGAFFNPTTAVDPNAVITFPSNDIAAISAASGAVSIEFWGQFKWNGDGAPVFTFGDGTGTNVMTQFCGNGQHVYCNVGGNPAGTDLWTLPGLNPLSNYGSTPVDVVDVFNSNTNLMQTYINSVLDFTQSMNGNSLSLMPSSVFTLGGYNPGIGSVGQGAGGGAMSGSISEFRIFNTALDPSVILALDAAGPNSLPIITTLASRANGSWNVASTWTPQAVPTSSSIATVGNAVTLNAAVGNALGVTVNSGGSVSVTAGTLNVVGLVTLNNGALSLDGASTLNVGFFDAAAYTGLSAAPGSTINVAKTLTIDVPNFQAAVPGVNLTAGGLTVSASCSTAGLGSFRLTGGNLNIINNSTFNLTQGTSSVANLIINSGDSSSMVVSGSSTGLTVTNLLDLRGDTPNAPVLEIQSGTVSLPGGANVGHDQGLGRILVSGGAVSGGNISIGFNGGVASLVVSNGATFIASQITAGAAWQSNTQTFLNNATMNVGFFDLGDSNGVADGTINYNNLTVAGSASLTCQSMTVGNNVSGGATLFAKTEQIGGSVAVNGPLTLANHNDNGSTMGGTYNLRVG